MTRNTQEFEFQMVPDASNLDPLGSERDQNEQHCVAKSDGGISVALAQNRKIGKRERRPNDVMVLRGATAPSGQRWILVVQGNFKCWVLRADFSGQAILAEARLKEADICLIGYGTKKALLNDVTEVVDFPPLVLAERSGWVDGHFVLPDGQVFSPRGLNPAEVVFEAEPNKCLRAGTAVGWRRGVARPLSAYDLPSFLLMMPFAAPLLALTSRTDNIGFELVGTGGRGKSTLQQLTASAVGAPNGSNPYWSTLDTTLSGLELSMPIHNDLLMVLDESNLYLAGTTEGGEARHMRSLAFKLANGRAKTRHGGKIAPPGSRFISLLSANHSFSAVTAQARGPGYRAAADRLLTLTMPDRPGGAIDRPPEGFASSGAFMETIKATALRNHGVAMPRFLQRLVDSRHRDEPALSTTIESCLSRFREIANVDGNDGSARRVADAFGLIAAGGLAAVQYGILPDRFRCMDVSLACYRSHLNNAQ